MATIEDEIDPGDVTVSAAMTQVLKRPRTWAVVVLALAALATIVAVDVYPVITNDSLAYLDHSNTLTQTGLVQIGYRQVGYPAFLATIDGFATSVRMEPLLLTALVQRFVFLAALGFALWLWRWRALPLVVLGLFPSLAVYTNFILTEGLAIGLALWYALLTAWVIRLTTGPSDVSQSRRRELPTIIAGASVGAIFVALVTIRFQYVLMVFGILAVVYAMYRAGGRVKNVAFVVAAAVVLLTSSFLIASSAENADEYGVFFPSVRGERSQFWAVWQVVFRLSPENQSNVGLADLYADGKITTVTNRVNSLPEYAQQRREYELAMNRLIEDTSTSWRAERGSAILGVLRGGRIDDVKRAVKRMARSNFWNVAEFMYTATPIRRDGVESFIDRYNNGRRIEPILVSGLAPLRSFPYFVSIYSWFLVASQVVLVAGIWVKSSRLLASVGTVTLLVTALVFGYLLMDNVRFLLVPLLFVLGVSTGVADTMWKAYKPQLLDSPR